MLCGAVTGLAAENLVQNPFMDIDEDGDGLPDNWQADWGWLNDGVLSMDTEVTHGGDASLKVVDGNYSWGGRVFQDIPVEPGKSYKFSGWIKGEKFGGAAFYRFYWHYSDNSWSNAWDLFEGISGTFDWTEQTDIIEVPEGVQELRIMAFATPGYGTLWYSDVSLVEAAGGAAGAVDTAMIEDIARKVAKEVVEENAGPARPGAVEFNGTLGSEFLLTPENSLEGFMKVDMNGRLKGIPNTEYRICWYSKTLNLWDPGQYGTNVMDLKTVDVSIVREGALWDGGPSAKTTLGDTVAPVADYIAGDFAKEQIRGVAVQGLELSDELSVTGFFGWPQYGDDLGKGTYHLGAVVSATVGDLDLTGTVFSRQLHPVQPMIVAEDGSYQFPHKVNGERGAGELVVYTPDFGTSTGTNPWGVELAIENGFVTAKETATGTYGDMAIPANGYVVSAHSGGDKSMYNWLSQFEVGDRLTVVMPPEGEIIPASAKAENVFALDASYSLPFGSIDASAARQINYVQGNELVNNDMFKADAEVDLNSAIEALADAAPLTLTAGVRKIDQGFAPYARETRTWVNWIEAHRGETGFNVGLDTTLAAQFADLDVGASLDWYEKADDKVTTPKLSVSTEVEGYALEGSFTHKRVEGATDSKTNTFTFGAEKTFEIPVELIQDFTADYDLSYTVSDSTTVKNVVDLTTHIDLPFLKGVGLSAGFTHEKTDDAEAEITCTAGLTYAFPNGLSLEAKYKNPDDPDETDDTFVKVAYELSF